MVLSLAHCGGCCDDDVSITTHAPSLILNDLTRSNLQLLAQISQCLHQQQEACMLKFVEEPELACLVSLKEQLLGSTIVGCTRLYSSPNWPSDLPFQNTEMKCCFQNAKIIGFQYEKLEQWLCWLGFPSTAIYKEASCIVKAGETTQLLAHVFASCCFAARFTLMSLLGFLRTLC